MKTPSFSFLSTILNSKGNRPFISWIVLLLGLAVWVAVQSYLVYGPLLQRTQLPEVDDSLAYLARTQVMEECPSLDCKALSDLRSQFDALPQGTDINRQRDIASFAFPFYHPLFSAILLSVNQLSNDLTSAYRILWALSPFFFGVALACFLASLWGRTVAGITLFFIAFKIFPGPGLHYFTPSNLSLIIALLMWARILSKNGSAPITLILGSVIMLAIHPIGVIFSLIALALALTLSEKKKRKQLYTVLVLALITCLIFFLFTSVDSISRVYQSVSPLDLITNFRELLNGFVRNLMEIGIQLKRYKVTFFGSLLVFFPATLLGFFYLEEKRRKKMMAVLFILILLLFASLFHSHALTPNAALFFRLLPPFAVVLFGALPHLIYITATNALKPSGNTPEFTRQEQQLSKLNIKSRIASLLILAILGGYMLETIVPGMIQVQLVREYMIKRQPLSFEKSQAQLLLSKASPEDSVLYLSTMIMASYFINNSLQLGAIYYHPIFANTPTSLRLQQSDVRFAVAYNPAVYHPTYVGLDEKNRCITSPELTFSPLSKARKSDPINQEGHIPAQDFHWIEIHPNTHDAIKEIKIFITNQEKQTAVELIHQKGDSSSITQTNIAQTIPAAWSGWLNFPLSQVAQGDSYRFLFPAGSSNITIGGISFDNTHHWPWSHQATMVLQGKDAATGRVQLSFNPSDLLPAELKNRPVTVIHDQGSSVLLEFTN